MPTSASTSRSSGKKTQKGEQTDSTHGQGKSPAPKTNDGGKKARGRARTSDKSRKAQVDAGFKREVRLLYEGRSQRAKRFRYALLAFDFVTIAYFLIVSFIHTAPWMRVADIVFAVLILLDFLARLWIAKSRKRYFLQLATWADMVVIASLLATFIVENLAYLRILRALRLMRSYHMMNALRDLSPMFRRQEHVIVASMNLIVFVFVVSALVYTFQAPVNPAINNYIDALYFTVTTLTTTGFGDIVLVGTGGRLLAVAVMIFGAALFLRLAQAIFRPPKVRYKCPQCGLMYHDPDASHCKHCGHVLNIPYEGLP